MDSSRVIRAMSRIEDALARIERAAASPRSVDAGDAELAKRHERLKDTVREQLGELDSLIARLER